METSYLQQCEKEPLQFSNAIQTHGALLAVDANGRVTHASVNIEQFFGRIASDWLGKPLPSQLSTLVEELHSQSKQRLALLDILDSIEPTDVVLNLAENRSVIIEFFHHRPYQETLLHVDDLRDATIETLCQHLTEEIAKQTGLQRVMLYLFQENGDGEVVNEVRQGDAFGSYLGLRYPASDVPEIARALYIKNPWRWIPDVSAESVPIIAWNNQTLDLSYSDLRSVSPVHQIYLGNMQVRASLSFPIVLGDHLFGLVACHHSVTPQLSLGLLENAAKTVRMNSLLIGSYQSQQRIQLVDGLTRRFNRLIERLKDADFIDHWDELASWLIWEFRCDGAALCLDDGSYYAGEALEPEALDFFDQWFSNRSELIWMSDSLRRQVAYFPLSQSAGLLALRVKQSNNRHLRLYLNRLEHIYEVAWGGNPDKPVEIQDGTLNIAPRRSFEKWVEKRMGYCRPWDNESRLLLLKLRELLTLHYA